MLVKVSQNANGGSCNVELDGQSFVLERPVDLVLAFLNNDYAMLSASEACANACAEALAQHSGAPQLRDMIDHVLVCKRERGFDPIARLAAHSFVTDMFDLSRVATFSERVSLESIVPDTEEAKAMHKRWNTLIAENSLKLPSREDLFQSLLRDAETVGCPFALKLSMEFSSLPQLLKSFVIEMIRSRELLRQCNCGKYKLAQEAGKCSCKK